MISENKIKTRGDLFREYGRVVDMCEGTSVDHANCWRYNKPCFKLDIPKFLGCPDNYKFAIAIVEDRPVFVGDELWTKDWQRRVVAESYVKHADGYEIWTMDKRLFTCGFLTWQEPRRTIKINGKTYPAPIKAEHQNEIKLSIGGRVDDFSFLSYDDKLAVYNALVELLGEQS